MGSRSLAELLQSTSEALYPAELGAAFIAVDSVGVDNDTPLHVLLWRNDTAGALLLIDSGAPINTQGDMGETPLHVAIRQENRDIIRALLAAGANLDIVSEFGQSPRQLARERGVAL